MSDRFAGIVAASESPVLSSEAQSLIVHLSNLKMQRESLQVEREGNRVKRVPASYAVFMVRFLRSLIPASKRSRLVD